MVPRSHKLWTSLFFSRTYAAAYDETYSTAAAVTVNYSYIYFLKRITTFIVVYV